jgi:hypothetical protein
MVRKSPRTKRLGWHLPAALLAAVLVAGCMVHIAPDYSPETANAIVDTEKAIDKFYANLSAVPAEQRKFQQFAQGYSDVEVEIRSLILRTKIQPMNEDSTNLANTALELWQRAEAKHKERDGYSDGLIADDQKRLDDLLTSMAVVQQSLKKPSN